MYSLFRAEWRKIGGNYPVMGFLVWIFPIASAILLILSILLTAGIPSEFRGGQMGAVDWRETTLQAWAVASGQIGRFALLAFASVVFAGEYQWGTWKNILTRAPRARVAFAKYATICAYMLAAFALMSVVLFIGGAVLAAIIGSGYGALNADTLSQFVGLYVFRAAVALASTLFIASLAGLAAIFTRSILGGVVVGALFIITEGLAPIALALIGRYIGQPRLPLLAMLLPSYTIDNVASWVESGRGSISPFLSQYGEPLGLPLSLALSVGWIALLVGLTIRLFQRQDITT
jgi:ABC-type transport system involved in multi-copper enzyme maturation permease subunit